jgi:two-component system OmpR family response regulator
MRILIVEDDQKIAGFVTKGLKEEGFSVDSAYDGNDGLYLIETNIYDVIILDWMLPGINGIEICKQLRTKKMSTPVLMLTARSDVEDRVEGLESGADDYLGKPFAFSELVARVKALHRRNSYDNARTLKADGLSLDPLTREVKREGKRIDLSSKEYELLEFLLRNKNRTVTGTMILENIWNMQEQIESNVINVTMYHLRSKIDKRFEKKLIKTIRGSGYRLEES